MKRSISNTSLLSLLPLSMLLPLWLFTTSALATISQSGDTSNLALMDFDSHSLNNYSILNGNGIAFGEKLLGQITTNSPDGSPPPTDIISGIPNTPLSLDSSVGSIPGLRIWSRSNTNTLSGTNINGDVGEGAITVLYEYDQATIGFDIVNGDANFFDIQFFDRNGVLLDDRRIIVDLGSASLELSLVFSSSNANIAAITIDNSGTNTGGGIFDNFRYSDTETISVPVVAQKVPGRINTGTSTANFLRGKNGNDVLFSGGVSQGVESIRGHGGADRLVLLANDAVVQNNADDMDGNITIHDFIIDNIHLNSQADILSIGRLLGVNNLDANTLGDYVHVISGVYGTTDQSMIFINLEGDYSPLDRQVLDAGAGLVGGQGSDLLLTFTAEQDNNHLETLTGQADNTVAQLQALIDMGFLDVSTTSIYGSSQGDNLVGTATSETIFSGGNLQGVESVRGNGGIDNLIFAGGDFPSNNSVGPNSAGHFRIRDFVIGDQQSNVDADSLLIGDLICQNNLDATNVGDYFHIISGLYGSNNTGMFINIDGDYTAANRLALDSNPYAGEGTDLFLEFQGQAGSNHLAVLTGYGDNTVDQFQVLIDWGFLDVSVTPSPSYCHPDQTVAAISDTGITITGTSGRDDFWGSAGDDEIFPGGHSTGVEHLHGGGGADRLIYSAGDAVAQDIADNDNGHVRIRDFIIDNIAINPEADSLSIKDLLGVNDLNATTIAPYIHIVSHVYGWAVSRGAIFINIEGDFSEADRLALDAGLGHDGGHGADLLLEFQALQGNNNFEMLTGYGDNSPEQLQALFDMGFLEPAEAPIYASCQEMLTQDPSAANGIYTIDPDGNGPLSPLDVYCDMTFNGGGWTLVGSFGNHQATTVNTLVTPDSNTYLADPIFQILLDQAVERVRFSFGREIGIQKENIGSHSCHNLNETNGLSGFNAGFISNAISWSHNELVGCDGVGQDYTLILLNADTNTVLSAVPSGGSYLDEFTSGWGPQIPEFIIQEDILLSQDLYIYVR